MELKTEGQAPIVTRWNALRSVLEIDSSRLSGEQTIMCVKAWDMGLETFWLGTGDNGGHLWDLGDWMLKKSTIPELEQWQRSIPLDVLDAVSCMPTLRTRALWLCKRHFKARSVIVDNPILAWLVIKKLYNLNREEFPVSIFEKKYSGILAFCNLPEKKYIASCLRRLKNAQLSIKGWLRLLEAIANPTHQKFFSHCKDISENEIGVILDNPWITASGFSSIIPVVRQKTNKKILEDVINMLEDVFQLRSVKSEQQLYRLHDRLTDEANRTDFRFRYRRDLNGAVRPFPAPPVEPLSGVTPITSQHDLFVEGCAMRHCVASYVDRILSGDYYVYKMIDPFRLTIGLKARANKFVLDEVKGISNRLPEKEVIDYIHEWLNSSVKI